MKRNPTAFLKKDYDELVKNSLDWKLRILKTGSMPHSIVDGKEVEIPKRSILFGIVEKYDTTKIIEENSNIPKGIRETCNYKYLKTLPYDYIIFVRKDILNSKELMNKINKK